MIKVYLDMDGVVADFDTAYKKIKNKHNDYHQNIERIVYDHKIFENLKPCQDIDFLLNTIENYKNLYNLQVNMLTCKLYRFL